MPRRLMFSLELIFDQLRFNAGIEQFGPGMFEAHLVLGPIGISMGVMFEPTSKESEVN